MFEKSPGQKAKVEQRARRVKRLPEKKVIKNALDFKAILTLQRKKILKLIQKDLDGHNFMAHGGLKIRNLLIPLIQTNAMT